MVIIVITIIRITLTAYGGSISSFGSNNDSSSSSNNSEINYTD